MLRGIARAAQLLRSSAAASGAHIDQCGGQLPSGVLQALHVLQLQHPPAARMFRRLAATSASQQQMWQHLSGALQHQQQPLMLLQLKQQRLQQQVPMLLLHQQRAMATKVEQQAAANPGLRFWKPTSPGQRGRVTVKRIGIWKGRPLRCLSRGVPRIGGRNAYGRITVRFRGGGSKRRLRMVDFKRPPQADGVVERLEYDPNRSGYIALVRYPPAQGSLPTYSYVLAPQDLAAGDAIASGTGVPIKPGNTLALKDIPVGMPINSIELHPGKGGQICRAAGCMATIVNKQEEHAIVRLPSGEQRLVNLKCRATIGAVSNPLHRSRVLGKAGANRHLGRRPSVRGVAMNPVDHPHGGGTAGGRPSCSPWGLHTKGKKTRDKHKSSNKWIVSRRAKRSKRG